ncbi:30S ribosome-binding factor RbfA [bacterium]|nr:30S ribosome-binding factor RbfA [bacterium]
MVKNTSRGPGQRQLRVGEMIRRRLSEILSRGEIHDPAFDAMSITIGEVSVSSDLKIATVYVMPLLGSGNVEAAVEALARHRGILRKKVSEEVILRHAPDLRFRRDETFDRLDETRRMFSHPTVLRDVAAPEDGEDDPASDA